jgi:hypothetical protein
MTNIGRLAIVAAGVLVAAIIGVRLSHTTRGGSGSTAERDGLIRITPQRIPLPEQVARDCISPSPDYGPHSYGAEVHIYANETAIDYRRKHPHEHDYPTGSKFVKEKYSQAGDKNPVAATIMERRAEKGDVSDWNFSIVALPENMPLKAAGEVSCARCHEGYKDTGFISFESEAAIKRFLAIE